MPDPQKLKPFFFDSYGTTIRFDAPNQPGHMGKITVSHPNSYDGEKLICPASVTEFWIDSTTAIELSDVLRASMDPMINKLLQPNPTLFNNG